uniref:Paraneoplastic antigen Ma-like C-terminal domain-containing protein n=1 Tax=Crocodylus porosus TaxID=8502 RepID=A0A7M4EY88_CROPO
MSLVLPDAFGHSTRSGGAYYELVGTLQCKGKTLSVYVLCLEPMLQCLVTQGALSVTDTDQIRLWQVRIGAQYSSDLLWNLNLVGSRSSPPDFSHLLREIHEEEEISRLRESMWVPEDVSPQRGPMGWVLTGSHGVLPQTTPHD